MTIIRVEFSFGTDYYRIDADEMEVQEAVDELAEEYDSLPEDEQDDRSDYILDGLEARGYDLWSVDVIDV